jgi:phosphoketolase
MESRFDRFHLAGDVVDRVPCLQRVGAHFKQFICDELGNTRTTSLSAPTTCRKFATGNGPIER